MEPVGSVRPKPVPAQIPTVGGVRTPLPLPNAANAALARKGTHDAFVEDHAARVPCQSCDKTFASPQAYGPHRNTHLAAGQSAFKGVTPPRVAGVAPSRRAAATFKAIECICGSRFDVELWNLSNVDPMVCRCALRIRGEKKAAREEKKAAKGLHKGPAHKPRVPKENEGERDSMNTTEKRKTKRKRASSRSTTRHSTSTRTPLTSESEVSATLSRRGANPFIACPACGTKVRFNSLVSASTCTHYTVLL